jgi:Prokaryotic E2 family A/ThiF family
LTASDLPRAVLRALRLIEAHGSVVEVEAHRIDGSDIVAAVMTMKTELPNSWRAAGQSPSGVRVIEPVSFWFGPNYPVSAPTIRLRADFDRSHPHLQPGDPGDRPEPCLIAGSPRELLRTRGILGLLEQLAEWLERAAFVQLNDPTQGWEPTRRDHIIDIIIADSAWLVGLPTRAGGCHAFPFRYFASLSNDGSAYYWATLKRCEPVAIAPDLTSSFTYHQGDGYRAGAGFALVAWSGKKADGDPFIADRYRPETVSTVDDLLARAGELGMRAYLEPKLRLLQTRFKSTKMKVPVPLGVLLLARRPYRVIGTHSEFEVCPYVVELAGNDALSAGSKNTVRPGSHREDIAVPLLRRASDDSDNHRLKWTLIGCGSVGSKIALHLARGGRAPAALVDSANIQPHNYARHALYPNESGSDYALAMSKAMLLNEALVGLKQPATVHCTDVVGHMMQAKSLKPLAESDTFAVVNTTGSATVREALSSPALAGDRPRVIESCLLGLGRVALFAVEGPTANPSAVDLITEAYRAIHARKELRGAVFGRSATEIAIGQGCSAATLALADTRVSMFAAAIADRLIRCQHTGMPAAAGQVLLGSLKHDDISIDWTELPVPPRILVGSGPGQVRISPSADSEINAEIARHPGAETGGILFGRHCDLTESFHVVGTLPAPPDSKFSADEFVLGTEGLRPMLTNLIEGSGGALYPLGTWHNHLVPSGPSLKDMGTAVLLSGMQFFPLLMLIHTPAGYQVLCVETLGATRRSTPTDESQAAILASVIERVKRNAPDS